MVSQLTARLRQALRAQAKLRGGGGFVELDGRRQVVFPWLQLGTILTVAGLTPMAWWGLQRLEVPIRLSYVLGLLWLLIGVPTLIGCPLLMLYSIWSGAYDPVRDDFMSRDAASLVRPRLLSAITWGLAASLCVVIVVAFDALIQRFSRGRANDSRDCSVAEHDATIGT